MQKTERDLFCQLLFFWQGYSDSSTQSRYENFLTLWEGKNHQNQKRKHS